MMVLIGKLVVAVVWVLCLGAFVTPYPEPWGLLSWGAVGMGLAHIVECVVFAKRVEAAPGNNVSHFIQLFFFGYFHALSLPEVK